MPRRARLRRCACTTTPQPACRDPRELAPRAPARFDRARDEADALALPPPPARRCFASAATSVAALHGDGAPRRRSSPGSVQPRRRRRARAATSRPRSRRAMLAPAMSVGLGRAPSPDLRARSRRARRARCARPSRGRCAPASFSPRKRSAAMVSPFEALSTYGLSICPGSPVSTIFVPSPERVMIVFTSCGVRFCASSTMMNCCGRLRPRMYVSGSTWICPLSSSSAYARGPLREPRREEELEVVEDRLHPRVELLVDVARQEADVAPERHDGARDEHARVRAVLDGALQARGEREQRLAGARLADERDEADRSRRAGGRARSSAPCCAGERP